MMREWSKVTLGRLRIEASGNKVFHCKFMITLLSFSPMLWGPCLLFVQVYFGSEAFRSMRPFQSRKFLRPLEVEVLAKDFFPNSSLWLIVELKSPRATMGPKNEFVILFRVYQKFCFSECFVGQYNKLRSQGQC